ncbi:MAG: hypothetical protein Q8M98_09220 [Candidatus Cloacimonadaceae bacterium]|nr:hypothetical protein [Candidatus Cloacimonadaceae bacterium]
MKKLILLALIAMMLIGMVAFSACKAKTEEPKTEEIAPAIEIPTDTTVVVPVPEPVPAKIK